MRKLFTICFLLIINTAMQGQNILQYSVEGLIGLKDKSGKILTPAKYEIVNIINDQYYRVESNKKQGVVDQQGKEIIKLKYDYIGYYNENLFNAILDEKGVYLDNTGREVLTNVYYFPQIFSEGVASVLTSDSKYGLIDKAGKELIAPKYDYIRPCSQGILFVKEKEGEKWAFIKKDGTPITPFVYTHDSSSFSDGFAVVAADGKFGYIDLSGKVVLPLVYEWAMSFYKGVAIVKKDSKILLIDKTGKAIKELKYDGTFRWGKEEVLNVKLDKKVGRIDIATGKEIIPPIYESMGIFERDFTSWVTLNNKWGIIDKAGKIVLPVEYDNKKTVYGASEGIYQLKKENKYGLLNTTAKLSTEIRYDSIASFREGFALVKIGNHFGFIDQLGQELTPVNLRFARDFSEGLAVIYKESQWHLMNKKAETLALIYNDKYNYRDVTSFDEGLAVVVFEGKQGCINKNGNLVIPLLYDGISVVQNGHRGFSINKKWGILDNSGNIIIPIKYDSLQPYRQGNVLAILDGKEYYFDKNGKEIEKPSVMK